tara:strand:- start:37 stop:534 length:498 start_codon:yes stop_codon:yes gene_type:complete
LILDNLSNPGITVLGTQWQFFTDRVMGGRSSGDVEIATLKDKKCYRMTGNVTTENNGGFIQMRVALDYQIAQKNFEGIKLNVLGNKNDYSIHIKTKFTKLYSQYYSASFNTTTEWSDIKIPFINFKKSTSYQPTNFNFQQIRTIGVVAAWKNFIADIALSEIGFY